MLTIMDQRRWDKHRANLVSDRGLVHALWLPMLLFASTGAVTWAIRGTTGWGGIDGTILPGLTWGILWYYLCWRKGIDARAVVFWLGMGLALGGELGYGIYVSWIQGNFHLGNETIPVSPWAGHIGFAICGIGWAAPGAIFLGWALGGPATKTQWAIRTGLAALLLLFILNRGTSLFGVGIIEWLGAWFAGHCPGLLFPNAHLGIYDGELGDSQWRIIYTNTQNVAVLLWWIVATLVALLQRDRKTLVASLIIGGGFGIGFPLSALWCYGYGVAPNAIDWWKVWELHSGFNLGIVYALYYFWCLRGLEKAANNTAPCVTHSFTIQQSGVLMALAGFVLIFVSGYEYFFWVGLAVACFFALIMLYATLAPGTASHNVIKQRQLNGLLIFSVFFLLFLFCHGVTSRLGVVLGIYGDNEIGQYRWPAGRIALFIPLAFILVAGTLVALVRSLHATSAEPSPADLSQSPWPLRIFDLITFIGVVGAASIWPEKIGVLYALFTGLAVFALARINRRFDHLDRPE